MKKILFLMLILVVSTSVVFAQTATVPNSVVRASTAGIFDSDSH